MADKERMEKLLCEKISRELSGFKQETLQKEKEEIYGMSYEDYRRQDFVEYLAGEIRKMQDSRRKEQEVKSA